MATIIFSALALTRNFFGGGESVCFHWANCRLVSGLNIGIHASSTVTTDEKKALFIPLSHDNSAWHIATREALFSSISIRGIHLAETFRIFRSSCKMVSTDPTDMPALAAICFTVKRRSSITICSTRTIMSSDRQVRGRGSFGLFSHDVWPSLNCRTNERIFFTSITPSLHVPLNCWWISMGFTQLLMNFDGFHAMQVEESDNHVLFFECKRCHSQYLKHYWHSTTSQAFNR